MLRMHILTAFAILSTLFASPVAVHAQEQAAPEDHTQTQNQSPALAGVDFSELRETDIGDVVAVVDPLTVQLKNGGLVHLTGLDFPDLDYYTTGSMSVLALDVLKDMLVGKRVKLYQTKNAKVGRENRMGHRIAHLEVMDNGLWVQGTILSLGLARMRTTPSNAEMADQMLAIEAQARAEKIGLWKIIAFGVHDQNEANLYIGTYQIIEGTVHNVGMRQNNVYLNFGGNWREDFTVSVNPVNRRDFQKLGVDLRSLSGARVRVRGWLTSYNGPFMEITHPAQIQIVSEAKISDSSAPVPANDRKSVTVGGSALPAVPSAKDLMERTNR